MRLRWHADADLVLPKQDLRQPKLKKQDVESGLGKRKMNPEVDDMIGPRGRIHVVKQDSRCAR